MAADESHDDKTQSFVALTKGTSVFHYEIIEKIGVGGMGEVYLALDTKLNRKVALKFLPPHLCQDEDCRKRFTREAQAAAKLSHPNIITIFEVSEYSGRPFLAMEYITGKTLRDLISSRELKLTEVIDLSVQLCEGLKKAHGSGVTHRDIKPSNIIIDSDDRPQLLDFGLATVQGSENITKTGSTLGTSGYMSPEQVQGESTDARSDLFSFGVVLYEMVSGQTPFRRDSETATSLAIVNDAAHPLARYRAKVPDELQRIVSKLLEKNPEIRYQTAADLLADLKREQEAISRPTGESIPSTLASPRRTGLWVTVSVLAVVAAVAATIILINTGPTERPVAQIRQLTFRGNVHQPAISPDGQHIAYVEAGEDDLSRVIMVQDLAGGAPVKVFEDETIFGIRWSPDGSELLTFAYNDTVPGIVLVPRAGGSVRRYRISGHPFAWSPDGDRFALHDYLRDRVLFVDKISGDTLPGSFEAMVWDMEWSPDGQLLALAEYTDTDPVLTLYSLADSSKIRSDPPVNVERVRWSQNGDAIYYLRPSGRTWVTPPDLMKISIDPHTGRTRGEPILLLSGLETGGGNISLSSDRKRLVYRKSMRWSNLWLSTLGDETDDRVDPIQLTFGTSQVWGPSISPDDTRVAFSMKIQNELHIFTLGLEGGSPHQVTHTNTPNWSPAWSPDAQRIAYSAMVGQNPRVALIDPLGGTPQVFSETMPQWDFGTVIWTPANRILYLGAEKCKLLDPESGQEEQLFEEDLMGWAYGPHYSPDGYRVALKILEHVGDAPGTVWDKKEIAVVSTENHQRIWSISEEEFGGQLIGWSPDGNWLYRFADLGDSSVVSRLRIEGGQSQDIVTLPWPRVSYVAMSSNCSSFVSVVGHGQFDIWLVEDFDPDME